jgi:hypothetical protein
MKNTEKRNLPENPVVGMMIPAAKNSTVIKERLVRFSTNPMAAFWFETKGLPGCQLVSGKLYENFKNACEQSQAY